MAFNRLMLTTAGKTQYAKAQQGKTLHFSRVAIGDGSIGTGSLVNRTALISEKMSLAIDTIQVVNSTESAIITGLSNSALEEGFYFREIGIFATDPDTSAEVLFLYDNAGTDGEFIPAFSSGVIINERLKFLILLDNVTSVTFTASGNPIYLSVDDIKDGTVGASALWSSTYIDARLNSVEGHITAAINTAAADATAKANAAQTAAEAASIPLVKKGAANGVAELDYSGKVPTAQLPSYVDDVLDAYVVSGATAYTAGWLSLTNGGAALTPEISKIYIVLSDGDYQSKTYRWSGTTYAEISPSIALGETSSTAYRGDRGKTAYEHRQASGNPHGTTPSDIGTYEKSQILGSNTCNVLGISTTSVPDDALLALAIGSGKYGYGITVLDENSDPCPGVLIQGVTLMNGNPAYTDSTGYVLGVATTNSVTLTISGYADINDKTQTVNSTAKVTALTLSVTHKAAQQVITSSGNVKFSRDVIVDIHLIGGGCDGESLGSSDGYGAGGGKSGYQYYVLALSVLANVLNAAVVGARSTNPTSPSASAFLGYSSQSGTNEVGGIGSRNQSISNPCAATSGGSCSTKLFGTGAVVGGGAGGGGGSAYSEGYLAAPGGSPYGGAGGACSDTAPNGNPATGYGGGGGGGGRNASSAYGTSQGGAGYQGAIYFKWRYAA